MSLTTLPPWNIKLQELIQFYIETTPPKTLGRLLRSFFLLNVAELKTVPPEWEEKVLHIIAMLELIDDVEDDQIE